MLTVVSDSADRDGSGAARSAASSVIDELVREGARRMLAEALRAEVEAYIAQFADVRDEKGHRLVVRNGCHEPRDGDHERGRGGRCTAPRVNDKRIDPDTGERQRFSSAILPAWARKSPQVGRGAAAAVFAWLVQQRFRPGVGAVPRVDRGSVRCIRELPRKGAQLVALNRARLGTFWAHLGTNQGNPRELQRMLFGSSWPVRHRDRDRFNSSILTGGFSRLTRAPTLVEAFSMRLIRVQLAGPAAAVGRPQPLARSCGS